MPRLLILAIGLSIWVPFSVSAQTCVISGRGLTHELRVQVPDSSERFEVRIHSDESEATLEANHRDAVVHALGWLELHGTQATSTLEVALREAVTLGDVVTAGADRAFNVSNLRMNDEGLVATLSAGNAELRDAQLPCSSIVQANERQQIAYRDGVAGRAATACTAPCARREVVNACELAYSEGLAVGQHAGTSERAWEPSEANRFVPVARSLRVHRTPVEPGTPVFASATATASWATVRGTESVLMIEMALDH